MIPLTLIHQLHDDLSVVRQRSKIQILLLSKCTTKFHRIAEDHGQFVSVDNFPDVMAEAGMGVLLQVGASFGCEENE